MLLEPCHDYLADTADCDWYSEATLSPFSFPCFKQLSRKYIPDFLGED